MGCYKSTLITILGVSLFWGCVQPLETLQIVPDPEGELNPGTGTLLVTIGSEFPSDGARNLATEVGFLTVTITNKELSLHRFATTAVSGGVASVSFSALPSGVWYISAGLYDSEAAGDLVFTATTEVKVLPGNIATANLAAIRTGTLGVTITEAIYPASVTLSDLNFGLSGSLPRGQTFQLIAGVLPVNSSFKQISWIVDKPFLASVDAYGRVFTHGEGVVKIKAREPRSGLESPEYTLTINYPFMGDWINTYTVSYGEVVPGTFRTTIPSQENTTVWRFLPNGEWERYGVTRQTQGNPPMKGSWDLSFDTLTLVPTHTMDPVSGTWVPLLTDNTPVTVPWTVDSSDTLVLSFGMNIPGADNYHRVQLHPAQTLSPLVDFVPGTTLEVSYNGSRALSAYGLSFQAQVDPMATLPAVFWGSSNPGVASFDSTPLGPQLVFNSVGTTNIVARSADGAGSLVMTLTITATLPPVAGLAVDYINPGASSVDPAEMILRWSTGVPTRYTIEGRRSDVVDWTLLSSNYLDTPTEGIMGYSHFNPELGASYLYRITPIGDETAFGFTPGASEELVTYVPEEGLYPVILTWTGNDPDGDRSVFSTTFSATLSSVFYADSSGTSTIPEVKVLGYGSDMFWLYVDATRDNLVLFHYTALGDVMELNPIFFTTGWAKIWKVERLAETGNYVLSGFGGTREIQWMGYSFDTNPY